MKDNWRTALKSAKDITKALDDLVLNEDIKVTQSTVDKLEALSEKMREVLLYARDRIDGRI